MLREKIIRLLTEYHIDFTQDGYEIAADLDRSGKKPYRIHPTKRALFYHDRRIGSIETLYQRITKKSMPDSWRKAINSQNDEPAVEQKTEWARERWNKAKPMDEDKVFGPLLRQYFTARGLDITSIASQIRVSEVDSARMRQAGAAFMAVMPMYRSWADAVAAAKGLGAPLVSGVQRLYLDRSGKKIQGDARRMLGQQGVMAIPPKDRRDSALIALGEGLETVLSACMALGIGGIVAWNAGRMKMGAAMARQTGQGILLLVDRDRSETGQMTCSELYWDLRRTGDVVYYALPPDELLEHEKTIDWNDILKRYGLSGTEKALRLAMYSGDTHVMRPGSEVLVLDGIRAVASSEEKPRLHQDIKSCRSALEGLLERLVDKKQTTLVKVPTGVGKTASVAAQALELDAPVLILTQDHDQANFYEKQGFFHYRGRTPTVDAEPHCPRRIIRPWRSTVIVVRMARRRS